jgi:hypothetical protein
VRTRSSHCYQSPSRSRSIARRLALRSIAKKNEARLSRTVIATCFQLQALSPERSSRATRVGFVQLEVGMHRGSRSFTRARMTRIGRIRSTCTQGSSHTLETTKDLVSTCTTRLGAGISCFSRVLQSYAVRCQIAPGSRHFSSSPKGRGEEMWSSAVLRFPVLRQIPPTTSSQFGAARKANGFRTIGRSSRSSILAQSHGDGLIQ